MDLGLIESEIQGLSQEKDKPIFKRIFREVAKTVSVGPVDATTGSRASANMRGHLYGPITTPAVANTEFSVSHRFGATPYTVVPILPNETDAEIVPLKWTRAWDAKRVYLSSSVASAMIYLYIEG
jgi:hypothetical protein